MTNRLERLALQRHLRISDQRRLILQILDQTRDQLTAQEVYRRARELHQRISLSTIHRTLGLLAEAGLLRRLEFRGRKARYEKAESHRQDRLIDVLTGRRLEFRSDGIEGLLKHAVHELGYRLLDYRLELFGTPERTMESRAATPTESEAPSAAIGTMKADGTNRKTDGAARPRSHRRSRH